MPSHRSPRRAPLALLVAIAIALLAAPPAAAGAVQGLRPNLRMAVPAADDILLQHPWTSPGTRLLRFTTVIENHGRGAFVVKASRACSDPDACPAMTTWQRIQRSDGTRRVVRARPRARYDVGDGHRHWHVMRVQRFELIPLDLAPSAAVANVRGAKTGFCFFDTEHVAPDLPGSPAARRWMSEGCGVPASTRITMGLSVGWGDTYPWWLPRQWIDTTGLPDGEYLLCVTADPDGHWLETSEADNQAWVRLTLGWTDDDGDGVREPAEETLGYEGGDRTPCETQLGPPPPSTGTWTVDLPDQRRLWWVTDDAFLCRMEVPTPDA